MGELSTILFARPSFMEGMGRVLDLGATMQEYNVSPTPEEADEIAFQADWEAVNEDIASIMAMSRDQVKELVLNGE